MNPERINNERGSGYRGKSGFIFGFRDEASERYARLLAQSPFSRRPQFMGPTIEDGKLVLESSGRRVVVEPETWEGLKDALLRIHFEYAPPKVPRVNQSGA
jgi:hypothetical protein